MTGQNLTDEQIRQARVLYQEGRTLGEIADTLGCSIYDLSPWLYMEGLNVAII